MSATATSATATTPSSGAKVTGTRPGDSVEVWFTARRDGRHVESEHFTYTVASDTGADALILASEDYTGVNPTYPAGTAAPKYADEYAAALDANGISHATWDVDAQGVPHPLGVLSHFDAVVWETGDDRLVQDPEDALTDTFLFGPVPDIAVAERQQYLTMALRDYLNEGGKLVQAGENTQYFGLLGRSLGGIFYGLAGAPDQDCAITRDFLTDCLLLSDDFAQYYLGATHRAPFVRPTGIDGRGPLDGVTAEFGGPAVAANPLNEAGAFSLTSDVLPAADYPQFAGEATSTYRGAGNVNPFGPVEGSRYAGALKVPVSYQRIGRTVDLTGVAGHWGADPADEAVVQHAADVPPRDRRGGAVGHRPVDDAARPQRPHVVGPTNHRAPKASSCRSTRSSAITCRRAGPAGRPAPPGPGTRSPVSRAGGSMPPSTCRPTPADRST